MGSARRTMPPPSEVTPWTDAGNSWPVERKEQPRPLLVLRVAATGVSTEGKLKLR